MKGREKDKEDENPEIITPISSKLEKKEEMASKPRNASLISRSFLESSNKTDSIESLATGDLLKSRLRRNSAERVNLKNSFVEAQKGE